MCTDLRSRRLCLPSMVYLWDRQRIVGMFCCTSKRREIACGPGARARETTSHGVWCTESRVNHWSHGGHFVAASAALSGTREDPIRYRGKSSLSLHVAEPCGLSCLVKRKKTVMSKSFFFSVCSARLFVWRAKWLHKAM